ncbi:MAG: chemotaxis protein CheW [Betaproteobacteria bacterium]|nr:chemotaxis protein CheW [Betaproteobacteria bacterium]
MSTDLKQFYQVFFEEAGELLAQMESLLLGLDVSTPSSETLNAIFRAAHSIKGGAATFGFGDMTELTHVLETLLDRLRKGELGIRSEMIDVFLEAGDVLGGQLAGHRGDGESNAAAAAEICAKLKQLAATGDVAVPAPDPSAAKGAADGAPAPAEIPQAAAAPAPGQNVFRIEFSRQGLTAKGMESLRAELGRHGVLEDLGSAIDAAEKKGKKKAGKKAGRSSGPCVLRLTSSLSDADIWEELAFLVDPASLKIEAEAAPAAPAAASSPGLGGSAEPSEEADFGFFAGAPSVPETRPAPEPAVGASGATAPPRSFGRRASDDPNAAAVVAGRRDNDKVAVSAAGESTSIRVSVEKVDQLINLVGELVITQAMLAQAVAHVDPVIHEKLRNGMSQLEHNTRDLQESVMSIRMMPISFVFSRFPRVVRDVASALGKQVELKTVGEGTELDKGLIEKIADPLNHLVRNSLDHGVEPPEKRLAAGKPAQGSVTLRAFHQGGNIVIEVEDDGAGLSREKILAKAKERGMPVNDGMSDQEVWQLIFEAGFSTAEKVTEVSGRGVGMDVVKRNVHAMGGRIEIESVLGVGTRIAIRLPLTLAILDGMSVSVGEEIFIIPLTFIVESLQPVKEDTKTVAGRDTVVRVRGEYLPVVALHQFMNVRPRVAELDRGIMVIVESQGAKVAVFVDDLLGQHQVVIKSLESNYRKVQGVSGATIMGDGRVALILDVDALVRMSDRQGNLLAA